MSEEDQQLHELRTILQRRFHELRLKWAKLGVATPPDINIEIQDIQHQIAEIDESLARIQPVRPVEDTPEMVFIPGGKALLGTDLADMEYYSHQKWDWCSVWYQHGQYKWEQPLQPVDLRAYKIARHPVTNQQYQLFVQQTGQQPPAHWHGDGFPAGEDVHPVVGVTWYDAWAYCDWLSRQSGEHNRLPTEAEWEKAARGIGGFRWPWGMEWDTRRCNSVASGYDHTTPVDYFGQQSSSPYGLMDCVGNVAEWCSTRWGSLWAAPDFAYPYNAQDGRELPDGNDLRVVRGGDFRGSIGNTRCAARSRFKPHKSLPTLGFRCVCDC